MKRDTSFEVCCSFTLIQWKKLTNVDNILYQDDNTKYLYASHLHIVNVESENLRVA